MGSDGNEGGFRLGLRMFVDGRGSESLIHTPRRDGYNGSEDPWIQLPAYLGKLGFHISCGGGR